MATIVGGRTDLPSRQLHTGRSGRLGVTAAQFAASKRPFGLLWSAANETDADDDSAPSRRRPAAPLAGAATPSSAAMSRDDLLDALTRHIQICAEISDSQARLACYDQLQTQVGDVQAAPPTPSRRCAAGAPPASATAAGHPAWRAASTDRTALDAAAAQCARRRPRDARRRTSSRADRRRSAPPTSRPRCRLQSAQSTSAYRPPEGAMPRPQPSCAAPARGRCRTSASRMPLVQLCRRSNLTYNASRYWQVTITRHLEHAAHARHPGPVHLPQCRPLGRRGLFRPDRGGGRASRSPPT